LGSVSMGLDPMALWLVMALLAFAVAVDVR
jgi:hypothetical protein